MSENSGFVVTKDILSKMIVISNNLSGAIQALQDNKKVLMSPLQPDNQKQNSVIRIQQISQSLIEMMSEVMEVMMIDFIQTKAEEKGFTVEELEENIKRIYAQSDDDTEDNEDTDEQKEEEKRIIT